MLQAEKVLVQVPILLDSFLKLPKPSCRTITLVPTQPLTEMSTRNVIGGKAPSARKVHNLTAICEPIV
jgi:hypothetical protein